MHVVVTGMVVAVGAAGLVRHKGLGCLNDED